MLRVTAIAAALILLFLLPAVAIHADDVRKHRKEDLAKDTSEAYRSVKEHVKEMKEDLVDSLREKGVEFKKGSIEGESDAKHDAYEHMPTLNDKINEAAHDTGYFAGATKEKLSETGEKLSESAHDAKETLKHKLFGAAEAAKDKAADAKAAADSAKEVKDAGARAKDSLDATKEKFKENLADAADNIARNKESIKESLKEAGIKAKEGIHYASDKVAEGAEALKADAEDALGHAKWKAEYAARKDATKENLDRLKDELHAEGHIIGHGVEAVKDSAANIKDEFKEEAKIIKDDASGLWQWLTGWFSGAKHTVAAKLKEEEAHTKSEIARQLHKAANAQDEEANRARAEYEALLSRLYGADESAKEVHRKLRREQQQMRRAAEAAKEKAHAATESLRESATELKHKAGAKFEETKEKVKEVAHDAKEKLSEKLHDLEGSARHGAQDLARECMLAEERIVGEAKSLAEADLKHQHGCNLREEVRLAEELRKAKEQREFVTESEERPKTGHGVGDSLRRAFQALNPFVGHA